MRKLKRTAVLLAVLFICLIFSACTGKEVKKPEISGDITFNCNISYQDNKFKATVSRKSGVWELEFTSPDKLCGITFTLANENLEIKSDDITLSGERQNLPATSIPSLVAKTLDGVSGKSTQAYADGDKTKVCGVVDGADFSITFKDNTPTLIEIEGNTFKAKITDFKTL